MSITKPYTVTSILRESEETKNAMLPRPEFNLIFSLNWKLGKNGRSPLEHCGLR